MCTVANDIIFYMMPTTQYSSCHDCVEKCKWRRPFNQGTVSNGLKTSSAILFIFIHRSWLSMTLLVVWFKGIPQSLSASLTMLCLKGTSQEDRGGEVIPHCCGGSLEECHCRTRTTPAQAIFGEGRSWGMATKGTKATANNQCLMLHHWIMM